MSLFIVDPEIIPPGGDESPDPLVLPRPPREPAAAEGGWPIMGPSPSPPRPPTSPVASPPPPAGPPAEFGGPTGPGPPPPPPGGCPPPPTGYMTSVVNPDLAADLRQLPLERSNVDVESAFWAQSGSCQRLPSCPFPAAQPQADGSTQRWQPKQRRLTWNKSKLSLGFRQQVCSMFHGKISFNNE